MNNFELESLLHTQIPLSRLMGVKVTTADGNLIKLEADLEPNHNHLGTAFGGSLSTLMILAAYCQIFQRINRSGHVVLKSSVMSFKVPVNQKLCAISQPPDAQVIDHFLKTYHKKGKARLNIESHILLEDGTIACTMISEFVGLV